jgi:hypothetical protein
MIKMVNFTIYFREVKKKTTELLKFRFLKKLEHFSTVTHILSKLQLKLWLRCLPAALSDSVVTNYIWLLEYSKCGWYKLSCIL